MDDTTNKCKACKRLVGNKTKITIMKSIGSLYIAKCIHVPKMFIGWFSTFYFYIFVSF